MSKFAELFPNVDSVTVKAEIVEQIQANVEDWKPRPSGLDMWWIEVKARLWSILMQQVSTMGAAAFKNFGRTIANVPPILAAPATVTSTWTATDDDGHTVEDGVEVKIPVPGGEPLGFVVVGDVTIAPGKTATAAGEVLLQAIEPGEAGNGLSGEATPISTVTFVDTIALVGASSGGVDEEDEDAYLDRLTEALQLLSLSLIVPRDLEIDARAVAGIARALCIPGYNPEDKTENNPLMFCLIPLDAAGASSSAPVQEELHERQQAKVPSGVKQFVANATHTKVDAFPSVTVLPGFDPATVEAAVGARLAVYFDPANWGTPSSGESTGWENRTKVYLNEVIAEVDRVQGVDRVVSLTIAEGGKPPGTADVTLKGIAPLAEPGKIEVTVV